MKRKISIIILLSILTSIFIPVNVKAIEKRGYLKTLIEKQYYNPSDAPTILWDSEKNIPRSIEGKLSREIIKNSNDAINYLNENLDAFNLNKGTFRLLQEDKDELGYTHYRLQYELGGTLVYGGNLILHTNKEGYVSDINGQLEPSIPNEEYNNNFKITEENALGKALEGVNVNIDKVENKTIDKIIYQYNKKWYSTYLVNIIGGNFNYVVFVNALNGEIIDKYDSLFNENSMGTGIGLTGESRDINLNKEGSIYYLEDVSRVGKVTTYDANNADDQNGAQTLPGTKVYSYNNSFNTERQKAAVDAHYYVGKTYDYFKNNYSREGYDGRGGTLKVSVHYGRNLVNAYFNGYDTLFFGDGDNRLATNFAKAHDIIAHEFTHGVTQNSARLEYRDQSGALNESFSDVFGCIIEGKKDWVIGEDIALPNNIFDLRRSLADPTLYKQPAHMRDYYYTQEDEGGVHTNSGIPNKAFYNIMSKLGVEKSSAIYYRGLTTQLYQNSQFIDARVGLEKAAEQLYGKYERWVVAKGFYDVGVGTDPGKEPDGQDQKPELKAPILTVDNATNNGDYKLSINVPSNNTAKTVKLIENNSNIIINENIDALTNEVNLVKEFKGKAEGKYSYVAELSDGISSVSKSLEVVVTKVTDPSGSNEVKVEFIPTSDWGSGANFDLVITNNSKNTLDSWQIEFSIDKKIFTMWNCTFSELGSNRYKISNPNWESPIQPGQKLILGGYSEGGLSGVKIYDLVINGKRVGVQEDINNDGKIDSLDIAMISDLYNIDSSSPAFNNKMDLNNDLIIDIYDIIKVSKKIE